MAGSRAAVKFSLILGFSDLWEPPNYLLLLIILYKSLMIGVSVGS